jgi:hypothetical protein
VVEEKIEALKEDNLNEIVNYVANAAEFVSEQAPIAVQEVLAYGLVIESVLLGVGVILFLTCSLVFWRASKLRGGSEFQFGVMLISGLVGIGSVVSIPVQLTYVLKVIYAPRVYLLEAMKGLL